MQRHRVQPRDDYIRRVEAQGLSFHGRGTYWTEDACYEFLADEVDVLEAATSELHRLYEVGIERVIREGRLGELTIPEEFHRALARSWETRSFSLYGRFDLVYDGLLPPKLLEYNADTPTSLLEAAVIQWTWKEDTHPDADQFNSLHERLIAAWATRPGPVAVACLTDQEEDWVCAAYIVDTLIQAGNGGAVIELEKVGWDPLNHVFVDPRDKPIERLFKLYPWEWLMREEFGPHLRDCRTAFVEPMYKAAFSSKAMLALLWEYFPGHPNLLETRRTPQDLAAYARKPLLSREGQNISLVKDGVALEEQGGVYGDAGYVYQALCPLPSFEGAHPVIGSWIVAGQPAGIGIRESDGLITTDQSHFVPHFFR